jgi:LeuA allosteric (dimerisation) domain.
VVQAITDRDGKELSSREIWEAFKAEYLDEAGPYGFVDHTSLPDRAQGRALEATIRVKGKPRRIEGHGTGPIDAFVDALARTLAIEIEVVDYHEHAVGAGANATAVAYVEARAGDGRTLFGVGMDKNIVTASLRAVTSAANRLRRVK